MNKNLLISNDDSGLLEVKIRRCGPGGSMYKIKTYYPEPSKKEVRNEKETKPCQTCNPRVHRHRKI